VAPLQELRARSLEGGLTYDALDASHDDAPAIGALDDILGSAVRAQASDIHLEPAPDGGRVRERVDGILREVRRLPDGLFGRILSRIKLLSGMDISDRRQPQDGGYAIDWRGRSIDVRVSSMPTIGGEKLVVRLLDVRARIPSLESLGMAPPILGAYRAAIHAPAGFVVVCGPTGSGKTTTLYSSIEERNREEQQLCTVEDPVEVRLGGIAQVQVNARAGLTFAGVLRSLLRQDPNVIMVGEMRDAETAAAANSAALSGQLVLTTLHSRNALGAIERLRELGLTSRAIAAGLSAVLAQRLLRRLCPFCKRQTVAPSGVAARLGMDADCAVREPAGCERCAGTGYRGRSAVFELLPISSETRDAIAAESSLASLHDAAQRAGYRPMLAAGIASVELGETSLAELGRVLETAPA
jgi:type IV pilus assembly protein PilB